jgi:hypothetical protein
MVCQDLPGYGKVWYHPHGIANILPLSNLIKKGYKITYSSSDGVEQLANGQQEATTSDDDDEPISIDINLGNNGEARSVAYYRSETEGNDPDTQDEVVDNNDDPSSASTL